MKYFIRSLLFVHLSLCLLILPLSGRCGKLQITLIKAKPAVVHIFCTVEGEVSSQDGQVLWKGMISGSSGSGFIINPNGYLVTNGHVVADVHESNSDLMRLKAIINFIQSKVIPQLEIKARRRYSDAEKQALVAKLYPKYKNLKVTLKKQILVLLSNKRAYPAEVKEYSPAVNPLPGGAGTLVQQLPGIKITTKTGKDVSILKIETRNLPTVKLGDSSSVQIGETIHVIGYPGAAQSPILSQESKLVEQTITTGHISGGKIDIKGTPMIQTDANIIWGNSGGPCINERGEVIGIVSYVGIAKGQAFSGFNWLVPINTAKEFIRAAGIDTNERSLFDKEWEKALNFFTNKNYRKAEEAVKNVLVYMPDQPDARRLLLRIKEVTIREGKSGGIGKGYFVIGVISLIAIVIGLFFIISRKKKETAIAPKPAPKPTKVSPVQQPENFGTLIGRGKSLEGRSFNITSAGLKIGRDPLNNDIVIDDEEVSREHAWIGPKGGKIVVRDLNTTNGTYINSISNGPIKESFIKPGDLIIIGKGMSTSLLYQKR